MSLNISKLKVAQLKAELTARKLPTSGLKGVLVQRLQEAIDLETQSSHQNTQSEIPQPVPSSTDKRARSPSLNSDAHQRPSKIANTFPHPSPNQPSSAAQRHLDQPLDDSPSKSVGIPSVVEHKIEIPVQLETQLESNKTVQPASRENHQPLDLQTKIVESTSVDQKHSNAVTLNFDNSSSERPSKIKPSSQILEAQSLEPKNQAHIPNNQIQCIEKLPPDNEGHPANTTKSTQALQHQTKSVEELPPSKKAHSEKLIANGSSQIPPDTASNTQMIDIHTQDSKDQGRNPKELPPASDAHSGNAELAKSPPSTHSQINPNGKHVPLQPTPEVDLTVSNDSKAQKTSILAGESQTRSKLSDTSEPGAPSLDAPNILSHADVLPQSTKASNSHSHTNNDSFTENSSTKPTEAEQSNQKLSSHAESQPSSILNSESLDPAFGHQRSSSHQQNGESLDPNKPPATRSLYIGNLLRPLTANQLKKKLSEYGETQYFWIDAIKTHAYVTFENGSAAQAAYTSMHQTTPWPPETGKMLSLEFLPETEISRLVAEEENPRNRGLRLGLHVSRDEGQWRFEVRQVHLNGTLHQPRGLASSTPSSQVNLIGSSQNLDSIHARESSRINSDRMASSDSKNHPTIEIPEIEFARLKAYPKGGPEQWFKKTRTKPHLYYSPCVP